jgi:dodecin
MADVDQGVIKIIELVGVSQQSFSDAVRQAVAEASKTVRGITGVDVLQSSAQVRDGQITEYHVNVKIAFAIERG